MARILKHYPEVALKPEDLDGKIDFSQIFRQKGPVHIEIGTGKATFLLNQAAAQPHVNFLGIEWARKYYRYAVDRIGRWSLSNVRIIRTEAAAFIADFVPDSCVDCFHIYFPDPWPKKRHRKRRLFCPANFHQLLRCLKPGGIIRVATDHAEYFQVIIGIIKSNNTLVEPTDFLPGYGTNQDEWVGTNFERKYLDEQRTIYTIAVRKLQQL
jgi:tRNA (guanine-N7-)-methyltransferase